MVNELADASGGIPFLVHLGAKEARDRQRRTLEAGEITRLLEDAVGDLDRGHQMTAFLTRLNRHYGDDGDLAAWLPDKLAVAPHDRSELLALERPAGIEIRDDGHLRTVLDWLRADHYLTASVDGGNRRYDWRYPSLRRIWELRRL